jgi:hypothetical protein
VKELLLTPPPVVVDAALAWLLRAAFAETLSEPCPVDAARALHLARATQLSGRVAKRLEAWRGTSELAALGPELDADYYANVANEALLVQAQDKIAQLGERLGVPIIALKFAGLRLARVITPGTRAVADLDLLLPGPSARSFWRALLEAGFVRTNTHEYSHQLEALLDPYGATIDLHVHVPGVFVEGRGFANADQLLARGLVKRMSGSLLVPSPALLCAHAIAHALLQNRSTPQTYSPLRMVADVMDLRRVQPDVVLLAANHLAPELRVTCDALERLCASLSRGVLSGPGFDGTREQTLLWHCVAARLDFDYSERLRAAGLTNKIRDGASVTEIARYVATLLYPGEPELEVLYGPAVGHLARMRRRLLRPVDLVVRAARRRARLR